MRSQAVLLRDEFRKAYRAAMKAAGWRKEPGRGGLMYREPKPGWPCLVGWGSFFLHPEDFCLDLSVMVKPREVTKLAAACWGKPYNPFGCVGLTEILLPGHESPNYRVEASRDIREQAEELVGLIERHGWPWMLAHCDLEAYLQGLFDTEGWPSGIEQIPIVLYMLGRIEEAEAYIAKQLAKRERRTYVYPCTRNEYEAYVACLRERLRGSG